MNRKIKALMVLEGVKSVDIAKKARVTETWVSLVLCGHRRSERVQRVIAEELGENPADLWPDWKEAA